MGKTYWKKKTQQVRSEHLHPESSKVQRASTSSAAMRMLDICVYVCIYYIIYIYYTIYTHTKIAIVNRQTYIYVHNQPLSLYAHIYFYVI